MINELPQAQRIERLKKAHTDRPSLMEELMGEDQCSPLPLRMTCEDELWKELMMASPFGNGGLTIPQLEPCVRPPPAEDIFNDDQPILVSAKRVADTHAKPYDLQQNLSLSTKARSNVVRLSSTSAQTLPVLLNIKTNELTQEQEADRAPIDLVCVVDISGSMCGQKIALLRNALLKLLQLLNEFDRISLVQFDDRAERLTPLMRVSKENMDIFLSKIRGLASRGGTNIGKGMNLAFKVLQQRKESNPVTSVFLLTDGLDPGANNRVSECLKSRSLVQQTFTIECFGFGADHDEELMVHISQLKNGSFYFIDKLDTVDESFAKALGGLMSVVALNVVIQIINASFHPFEGIRIGKTYGGMWVKQGATSGYQIRLNHLIAGVEKGFMMELQIPPTNVRVDDMQRTHCVLQIYMSAQDNTQQKSVSWSSSLKLQLLNQNEPLGDIEEDGEVMENYFRVQGAEAIEAAIELSEVGKYEEGCQKLNGLIEQITQSQSVDPKRVQPLLRQLQQSKSNCQPDLYELSGKKYMLSGQRGFLSQSPSITSEPLAFSNSVQARLLTQVQQSKSETAST